MSFRYWGEIAPPSSSLTMSAASSFWLNLLALRAFAIACPKVMGRDAIGFSSFVMIVARHYADLRIASQDRANHKRVEFDAGVASLGLRARRGLSGCGSPI